LIDAAKDLNDKIMMKLIENEEDIESLRTSNPNAENIEIDNSNFTL
jgi:hypothetical protein